MDESVKILNPDKRSLEELLALEVQSNPESYALSILSAFKKGDTGAVKLVQQALESSKFQEEVKFPINDKRFKDIIVLAADKIRGVR